MQSAHIKCKLIEETKQTRIDRLAWNREFITLPEDKWVANSLKDVKIVHNSVFMVEMKDEADIEDDAVIAEGKQAYQATVIKLDDTLNERTVIANMQGDTVNVKVYPVNLEWTLQKLTDFLVETSQLQGPHRLRNLFDNKNFCLEEMDSKLKSYQTFRDGGARI
jgi:hypothetical protein